MLLPPQSRLINKANILLFALRIRRASYATRTHASSIKKKLKTTTEKSRLDCHKNLHIVMCCVFAFCFPFFSNKFWQQKALKLLAKIFACTSVALARAMFAPGAVGGGHATNSLRFCHFSIYIARFNTLENGLNKYVY